MKSNVNEVEVNVDYSDDFRHTEAFLNSIIENIPDMIFVKDAKELRFVRFNKAGEELLGYPSKDLIGKNDYDFFPKEEAEFFTNKDRQVLNQKKLVEIEEEPIHTRHHGTRTLHTKKIPILDNKGNPRYLLGISEDITEKRAAETSLKEKTQELERSNKELAEFAYVVSHDLQEPLRKISNFANLLVKQYGGQLDEKGGLFLGYMVDGAKRMQHLVDDLLSYARLGNEELALKPTNFDQLMLQVIKDLEVPLKETRGRVTFDPLPTLLVNDVQMGQVLQNLISNGLKFHGHNPPHVHVSAVRNELQWMFSVKDNGIGIDQEHWDQIFMIFQRLHTRMEYPGTGTGLATCKKIIERHKGKIWIDSNLGMGSTFRFSLPVNK